MGRYAAAGLAAALGLALIPLAAARSDARTGAAAAGQLVLGRGDAPGLKPAVARAAAGSKAVAAVLGPADATALRGRVQAAHFTGDGIELWSFAVVLRSRSAAAAQTNRFGSAVRRAGLRPARAGVGEQSWIVARRGAAVVTWRRQNAVGEILLSARLTPPALHRTAARYAAVSDSRMADVLGRDAWHLHPGADPGSGEPRDGGHADRPWLIEGMAVWAAADSQAPPVRTARRTRMKDYVPTVGLALFASAYTAVGSSATPRRQPATSGRESRCILLAKDNEASLHGRRRGQPAPAARTTASEPCAGMPAVRRERRSRSAVLPARPARRSGRLRTARASSRSRLPKQGSRS